MVISLNQNEALSEELRKLPNKVTAARKRNAAQKTLIKHIKNPQNLQETARVKIIGTMTNKLNSSQFLVDDGTGQILIKTFNSTKFSIGHAVSIIGKIYSFNPEIGSESFIVAEITKEIKNPLWIKVHQLESKPQEEKKIQDETNYKQLKQNKKDTTKDMTDKKKEAEESQRNAQTHDTIHTRDLASQRNKYEIIIELIKEMDNGDGVSIEKLTKNLQNNEAEKIIESLISNGEIFEIEPGKIKIL